MIFISSRADRYLLEPIHAALGNDPRYLVVLGDRRETMQAAWNAFLQNTPLVHIQGGEQTPFSMDDVFRDCISRMADLHFPPTREAAQRVREIHPGTTVYSCGAIGAQLAHDLVPILCKDLPFRIEGKTWLVTWHPQPEESIDELIGALQEQGGDVIWTYPNADPEREAVISKIHGAGYNPYVELTMPVYLSLMHYVTAVVGNSSSGLIEAPSIGAQTINIGNRQTGRPQASSITSVACKKVDIYTALHLTNYMPVFPKINPYYMPGTINTIVRKIKEWASTL